MAALDFPPSSESPFIAPNGVVYFWNDDGFWEADTSEVPTSDNTFLKLDASNDPVTGNLNITGDLDITGKMTSASTGAGDGGTTVVTKDFINGNGGTGSIGYWDRSGTSLSPVNGGDSVLIGGTLPLAPNISLNASGNIEAENIALGGMPVAGLGTAPGAKLRGSGDLAIASEGEAIQIFNVPDGGTPSNANETFRLRNDGTVYIGGTISSAPNISLNADGTASFKPSGDGVNIDSLSRLLVGKSSAPSGSSTQYSRAGVFGNTLNGTTGYFNLSYGQAATSLSAGVGIGRLFFGDAGDAEFASIASSADGSTQSGDYPGRLIFKTTADGASLSTERMRINRDGDVLIGGTLTPSTASPNISLNASGSAEFASYILSGPNTGVASSHATGVTVHGKTGAGQVLIYKSSSDTTAQTRPFFGCYTPGASPKTLVEFASDGSAEFAGNVGIGINSPNRQLTVSNSANPIISVQNSTTNAEGVFNAPSGGTVNFGSATDHDLVFSTNNVQKASLDTTGNFLIGGTLPSAPNITLNADGSGRFKGQVNAQNDSATASSVYAKNANSSGPLFYGADSNGFETFKVNSNGSAEFAGSVTSSNRLHAKSGSFNSNDVYLGKVTEGGTWDASAIATNGNLVWGIGADGSATFATTSASPSTAHTVTAFNTSLDTETTSTYFAQNTAGGRLWKGSDGTETSTIWADGSATFDGLLTVNEAVRADRTGPTQQCFSARLNGTANAEIFADGSATFASDISIGGTVSLGGSPTTPNLTLSPTGTINGMPVGMVIDAGADYIVWQAPNGNKVMQAWGQLNTGGSAPFAVTFPNGGFSASPAVSFQVFNNVGSASFPTGTCGIADPSFLSATGMTVTSFAMGPPSVTPVTASIQASAVSFTYMAIGPKT